MASSSFFTITQPCIGAPLQFSPPMGSPDLERLINAYVPGFAPKQDKISEVTIDFYTTADMDLNTGALFKRYDVYLPVFTETSFEPSPTYSSSSIFTPSPGSSMALGDSGYGSMGWTPPNRTRDARITKKAKKDTKKTAELRLPGFSIMTKDGVDVTTSASRGTKTKEQREHAHLMRIIKACDDCKRKKIRCDPSHRTQHTDMSRTSTSTSNASSSRRDQPTFAPSIAREPTHSSQGSTPSFVPSSTIDDFVLFPEDDMSWDIAGFSLPEFEDQNLNLTDFNFDISQSDSTNLSPVNSHQPINTFDYSYFSESPPQQDYQGEAQSYNSSFQSSSEGLEPWESSSNLDTPFLQTNMNANHSQVPGPSSVSPHSSLRSGEANISPQSSMSGYAEYIPQDGLSAWSDYSQPALQSSPSDSLSSLEWLPDLSSSPNVAQTRSCAADASRVQSQAPGLQQYSRRPVLDEQDRLEPVLEEQQTSASPTMYTSGLLGPSPKKAVDWRQHEPQAQEHFLTVSDFSASQPDQLRRSTEQSRDGLLQSISSRPQSRTVVSAAITPGSLLPPASLLQQGIAANGPDIQRQLLNSQTTAASLSRPLAESTNLPIVASLSRELAGSIVRQQAALNVESTSPSQLAMISNTSRQLSRTSSAPFQDKDERTSLASLLASTLGTSLLAITLMFWQEQLLVAMQQVSGVASLSNASSWDLISSLALLCALAVTPLAYLMRSYMASLASICDLVLTSASAFLSMYASMTVSIRTGKYAENWKCEHPPSASYLRPRPAQVFVENTSSDDSLSLQTKHVGHPISTLRRKNILPSTFGSFLDRSMLLSVA